MSNPPDDSLSIEESPTFNHETPDIISQTLQTELINSKDYIEALKRQNADLKDLLTQKSNGEQQQIMLLSENLQQITLERNQIMQELAQTRQLSGKNFLFHTSR